MTTPKFSIIIPVYNVATALPKCLQSVLNQRFLDYEVLVVDDGSTDGSDKVCDEFSRQSSKFRVYHKQNGGASSARNMGLEYAKGEWICFIDSDDYVDENFLSCFDEMSCRGDLLSQGYTLIDKEKNINRSEGEPGQYVSSDNMAILLTKMFITWQMGLLWCKAFKRSIIEEHRIRFDTALRRNQDWKFMGTYCSYIHSINNVHEGHYFYYNTPSGKLVHLTSANLQTRFNAYSFAYYSVFNLCKTKGSRIYLTKTIGTRLFNLICDTFYKVPPASCHRELRFFLNFIYPYRQKLEIGGNIYHILKHFMLRNTRYMKYWFSMFLYLTKRKNN